MKDFRHVIRHEIVHVFMTNKVYRILKDHRIPTNKMPPLWFVEGLAEFYSTEWDAQAEMLMRDAVLNNYFVNLDNIFSIYGSFLMYKEGQNFLEFAAEKYGEERIGMLIDNFWMYSNFNQVIETTFKESFEQIDAEWNYWLRKKYYPLMKSSYPTEFGSHKVTKRGFNFTPVYFKLQNRHYLYYLANLDGYSSIYRIELSPEYIQIDSPELILRGEQTEELESFHLFQSAIDISDDGLLVFNNKKGGTDVIHFFRFMKTGLLKLFRMMSYFLLRHQNFPMMAAELFLVQLTEKVSVTFIFMIFSLINSSELQMIITMIRIPVSGLMINRLFFLQTGQEVNLKENKIYFQ
ncbi:MAG: hypothetical protein M5T52_06355 [Ignavibacteriaceae bacterium]|nr:hypothetical protein [Ignavibacteriaceae bacterium]